MRERYGIVPAFVDAAAAAAAAAAASAAAASPSAVAGKLQKQQQQQQQPEPAWAAAVEACLEEYYAVFAPEKAANARELVRGLVASAAANGDARGQVRRVRVRACVVALCVCMAVRALRVRLCVCVPVCYPCVRCARAFPERRILTAALLFASRLLRCCGG